MKHNLILDTDSYKAIGHYAMMNPDVQSVFSYMESRGGRWPATVFFGLQPILRKLAAGVTQADLDEAVELLKNHGGDLNIAGWQHIIDHYGGRLPVTIRAVPEGSIVPTGNALVTVETNGDPKVAWLGGYLETMLLRQLWYSCSVATRVAEMRFRMQAMFDDSIQDDFDLSFSLIDFSSRGCSSYETNQIGGAAFLTSFKATDSIPALRYVRDNYDTINVGFSVPASEHSVMCSWGEMREKESFLHMLDKVGKRGGIVSIVADTWDVFAAAEKAAELADEFKSRGVTLCFRPDSGRFEEVLPAVLRTLERGFGSVPRGPSGLREITGAKVLWGDGITDETFLEPFRIAMDASFSPTSIGVGSGGGLMQSDITRDTAKFAFKASAMKINNKWIGVSKNPVTDTGKRSKEGRLVLELGDDGIPFTTTEEKLEGENLLQRVFAFGTLFNQVSLNDVRDILEGMMLTEGQLLLRNGWQPK